MNKFFEDVRVGEQASFGHHTFTEEDIISFAGRYDPQPFHTDTAAAKASYFGGLIASGWHTASVAMRLWINYLQSQGDIPALAPGERKPRPGPSPGIRDLRWHRPVRSGDTITYAARVVEKTELRSRPQWGIVSTRFSGVNQDGIEAISFLGQAFVERRGGGR